MPLSPKRRRRHTSPPTGVAVTDLGVTEALFNERGVSFGKVRGRLRIIASEALGVVIEFSAAQAGSRAEMDRNIGTRIQEAT